VERGITLAAGEAARRTMLVPLRPGLHVIELILSETVARRDVGDGKFLKAFVVVRGPCRPPPESIIIMPRPEPPSEPSEEKPR
jgi:hypothetical protein